MEKYYIYIMTNKYNTVLYTGVTSNLHQRILQHRNNAFGGFTTRYNITKLIYFEEYSDVKAAIAREKQLKHWNREKKNGLIESLNPDWNDLGEAFI